MSRRHAERFGEFARGLRLVGEVVLGSLVVLGVLVAWVYVAGLQVAGVQALARAFGATPIDAWGWGHFGVIPAVCELVALVFLAIDLPDHYKAWQLHGISSMAEQDWYDAGEVKPRSLPVNPRCPDCQTGGMRHPAHPGRRCGAGFGEGCACDDSTSASDSAGDAG